VSDYYRGLPEPGRHVPPSSEPSPPRWVNPEDADVVVQVTRPWRGSTWEYHVERVSMIGAAMLTALGNDGWELVAVLPRGPNEIEVVAYFKRPGPDVDPLTGRAWCS
jgi:hypothetical protein